MSSQLLQIESYRKGITFSFFFNLLAKGLLFAISLAIAYFFGAKTEADMYFYCLLTVRLLTSPFIALNSTVIIPEAMRLRTQEGERASMAFANLYLALLFAVGLVVLLISSTVPTHFMGMVSQFDSKTIADNSSITLFIGPLALLTLLSTCQIEILNSYRFFTLPMIASMANSAVTLGFLFLFHRRWGITSLLAGAVAAQALQIVALSLLMFKSLSWRPVLAFFSIGRRQWIDMVCGFSGNLSTILATFLPVYFLSGFAPGGVATVTYAQRIADLISVVVTVQFLSVAGIKFNELFHQRNWIRANEIALSTARFLYFLLFPITIYCLVFRLEIVKTLFRRGAFDKMAAIQAAPVMAWFCLPLVLMAVNALAWRVFISAQLVRKTFWYLVSINTLMALATFLGIRFLGVIGYPIGFCAVQVVNVILLYGVFRRVLPVVDYLAILRGTLHLLPASLILLFVLFGAHYAVVGIRPIWAVAFGGLVLCVTWPLLNHFLKLNSDFTLLMESMQKALKRDEETI
jgi:putative peptidoglycan lipid II flippase